MSGSFLARLLRARMASASHVAKVPLQFCTDLSASALPACSLRARAKESTHPW